MVARIVYTTESSTTDSATNPKTFTETPESGLENSEDTDMIIDDPVDPNTKERIMNAVNQSLASNRDKVQVLDSTIRILYTAVS